MDDKLIIRGVKEHPSIKAYCLTELRSVTTCALYGASNLKNGKLY